MKTLFVVMVLAVVGFGGTCDSLTEACGPCGKVSTGDGTISGDAKLDGFFKAVGTLGNATASVQGDFRANLEGLGVLFGACVDKKAEGDTDTDTQLCADLSIGDLELAVKGAITAEIDASVDGGLTIEYQAPACSANVSVAVDAQAQCEAKAGCEGECDPGSVEVKCEGSCSGGCTGGCSGKMECSASVDASGKCGGTCSGSCEVEGPALTCEGKCTGGCSVDSTAECSGTCKGQCSGECSATATDGSCAGQCTGTCTGKCEVNVDAKCDGECNGKCVATPPKGQCEGSCKGECKVEVKAEADCQGEVKCDGSCSGSCSGGCEGKATPPSCHASCDASVDCNAQASAQASASLECTPPSLAISYKLNAALEGNAQAKAEFMAKMEGFRVRMIAIVQGMFKLRALVDPAYATEIGIESPVATLTAQIKGFVTADFSSYDVPAGLIPCLVPAFTEAGTILGSVATDTMATVKLQLDLFTVLNVG